MHHLSPRPGLLVGIGRLGSGGPPVQRGALGPSALPQTHLSHFFVAAWQQDAGEEVAKATRESFSVKNGPRFGPFNTGDLEKCGEKSV